MFRSIRPALVVLPVALALAWPAAAQSPSPSKIVPLVLITQRTDIAARPEAWLGLFAPAAPHEAAPAARQLR